MKKHWLVSLVLLGSCHLSFAVGAFATEHPGSLLVFPEFDSSPARATLLTVTNTNTNVATGQVAAEFVYIDGSTCLEFNRTELLSPGDTFTTTAVAHNPNQQTGFLYVFAKNPSTGQAIHFNWLTGNAIVINAVTLFDYGSNPFTFAAVDAGGPGSPTDVDGDGLRDLNGLEYEPAPGELLIPRFLGQGLQYQSNLVFINLTGGSAFTASVDFKIFNDNEEYFSGQYSWTCWKKVSLGTVSGAFANSFLELTNDAPNEIYGSVGHESGWFSVNGNVAYSSSTMIRDPAVLVVLSESIGPFGAGDLPYTVGTQTNGDLLPHGTAGDTIGG